MEDWVRERLSELIEIEIIHLLSPDGFRKEPCTGKEVMEEER
jgi:hypothetical protein